MRLSISRTPPTHTARASSAGAGPPPPPPSSGLGIAELGVLEPRPRLGGDRPPWPRADDRGRAVARRSRRQPRRPPSARGTQRAAMRVLGAEAPVAARQREAVGLAHRRHADDLDAEVEVGGHAADRPPAAGSPSRRTRATCGRTAWNSLVTTVVTPRKCPGRRGAAERLGEPARPRRRSGSPRGTSRAAGGA